MSSVAGARLPVCAVPSSGQVVVSAAASATVTVAALPVMFVWSPVFVPSMDAAPVSVSVRSASPVVMVSVRSAVKSEPGDTIKSWLAFVSRICKPATGKVSPVESVSPSDTYPVCVWVVGDTEGETYSCASNRDKRTDNDFTKSINCCISDIARAYSDCLRTVLRQSNGDRCNLLCSCHALIVSRYQIA